MWLSERWKGNYGELLNVLRIGKLNCQPWERQHDQQKNERQVLINKKLVLLYSRSNGENYRKATGLDDVSMELIKKKSV